MNITLVGTGSVAVILGKLLLEANHKVVEVYGRNETALNEVSGRMNAKANRDVLKINTDADVCIIAVSDNAIETIAQQIVACKTLIVHTSGATSKEVLHRFTNYGVMYPLQSLRKEVNQLPAIPFFIDANTKTNVDILYELASSTGNKAMVANDEERLNYHVAAVLCSNFTNHLYALTEDFCNKKNINFKNLFPLIKETAERLQYFHPAQLQTGPAIRHDTYTIQRHLTMLQAFPDWYELYQTITRSIQQFSK